MRIANCSAFSAFTAISILNLHNPSTTQTNSRPWLPQTRPRQPTARIEINHLQDPVATADQGGEEVEEEVEEEDGAAVAETAVAEGVEEDNKQPLQSRQITQSPRKVLRLSLLLTRLPAVAMARSASSAPTQSATIPYPLVTTSHATSAPYACAPSTRTRTALTAGLVSPD